MRHLLTVIIAVAVLAVTFLTTANNRSKDKGLDSRESAASADKGSHRYYGDTLYQYDGNTVVYDYDMSQDQLSSCGYASAIVTYAGTVPVDTCKVFGNGWYSGGSPTLRFAIGVDTVCYDIRNLPDSVDPVRDLLPAGIRKHSFIRSFALNDSALRCDFRLLAYLPESHPVWLNQFIGMLMRNGVLTLYDKSEGTAKMLSDYYSVLAKPEPLDGIDYANTSMEDIARHCALEHERLYRNDWADEENDCYGPKYDYIIEIAPAWTSHDNRYATYRFYEYYYTMGAHGYMQEYYLTFDNSTGRLLGYEDIIGDKDFPKVIKLLEDRLLAWKVDNGYVRQYYSAAMGTDEGEVAEDNISFLQEKFRNSYYPRPAVTGQGVVFTYQPYEKGCFADGIIHLPTPFSSYRPRIATIFPISNLPLLNPAKTGF